MKKLLTITFATCFLLSCRSEHAAINTIESLKTPEMLTFDKALKSVG